MDLPNQQPDSLVRYYVVFILGGLILGLEATGTSGGILGGVVGYVLATNIALQRRLARFEQALSSSSVSGEPEEPVDQVCVSDIGHMAEAETLSAHDHAPPDTPRRTAASALVDSAILLRQSRAVESPKQSSVDIPPEVRGNKYGGVAKLITSTKKFFTTGNVILKIGLVILFFGVSFLLKYAAQRNLVPIELRLVAVTFGGIALLGIGWRLRHRQLFYGLFLQGGGVGVLYLTVFAAAKLYLLLPFGLAFVLMVALVALSGALAVLQNEKWLAISGSVGGFLAPVLLSTGSGSHVALFSYYLLLNFGILGIAWFKAWRELNLLGFVLTFIIGAFWGGKYYQPLYFSSVEPFLLANFSLYVLVSVLFSLKQPVDLKGYIDPPLVFGVPITTFALQVGLVKNFEHGLAISAVGFGIFYILCAVALWRRFAAMRMLVEVFLSFGVVFGSLAIPLALDGHWITAAWSMEGAALIWVGVRQARLRARVFGVLLQLGAGISLLGPLHSGASQFPIVNGLFLGCAILAMAAFFSSYYLTIYSEKITLQERQLIIPLLVWGVCWWFGGGVREIDLFVQSAHKVNVFLLYVAASCLAMGFVARRLSWRHLVFPPLLLLPVIVLLSFRQFGGTFSDHHFAGWGAVCWLVALAAQYRLLFVFEKEWPRVLVSSCHRVTLWLVIFLLSQEGAWVMGQVEGGGVWRFVAWGLIPAAFITLVKGPARQLDWPITRFHDIYQFSGNGFVVIYLCCWSLLANFQSGDPAPLPFLPLLNPLEVSQVLVLLICCSWAWQSREWLKSLSAYAPSLVPSCPAGVIIFLWLNAAVARAVHFYGAVPYDDAALFHSVLFQAAIAILWSLTALALMTWSAQKLSRQVWMVGALLLALVVLKLFMVDLSGAGTIGRIVSFLGVGLLMLLIGYMSPLPPRQEGVT